jgi:hypothetical protein
LARFNGLRYAGGEGELVWQRIYLCPYKVWIITYDEPTCDQVGSIYWSEDIPRLSRAWQEIRTPISDRLQKKAWEVINKIGKPVGSMATTIEGSEILNLPFQWLWQFREVSEEKKFFLFLSGHEKEGLSSFELYNLVNLWQIDQEHLPIHSAGVIRNEELYLFGGVSGAGKSTLSTLSLEHGYSVLDEDQVSLYKKGDGSWSANAWGKGLTTCSYPIRAIFSIKKSQEDRIVRLSQPQTAKHLVERFYDMMGALLTNDLLSTSFTIASDVTRQVPGYELHFRKSPDFWDVINAELGL